MDAVRYSGMLSDAIDEGLSVLGEMPMQAIYGALENDFDMQKADIPARFAEFSRILRDSMGSAAEPILKFIIDRFYHELQVEPNHTTDLEDSITHLGMILKGDLPASGERDQSGNSEVLEGHSTDFVGSIASGTL